jgi:hypothetical protein
VAAGDPQDGTASIVFDNGASSSFNVTGMTTATNNSGIVCYRMHRSLTTRCSAETLGGTSITELIDVDKLMVCTRIQAVAGATGNWAGTDDDAGNDRFCGTMAFKAA